MLQLEHLECRRLLTLVVSNPFENVADSQAYVGQTSVEQVTKTVLISNDDPTNDWITIDRNSFTLSLDTGTDFTFVNPADAWTDNWKLDPFHTDPVEILVTFTPTAQGARNDNLDVDFDYQTWGQPDASFQNTVALTATGLQVDLVPANVKITGLAGDDPIAGQSFQASVSVQNLGPDDISQQQNLRFYLSLDENWDNDDAVDRPISGLLNVPALNSGGSTVITSNVAIPGNVPDGTYFVLAVVDPDNAQPESSEVNNVAWQATESLIIQDTNPLDLANDPDDRLIDFQGITTGNTTDAALITITNVSQANVTVTDLLLTGDNSDSFAITTAGGYPFVLDPMAEATISVTFTPSMTGDMQATLTITTNEVGDWTMNLQGTGLNGPELSVTENTGTPNDDLVDFGNVRVETVSDPVEVTLTNIGDDELVINSLAFASGQTIPFAFATNPVLPIVLAPQATADLSLVFNTTTVGVSVDTLVIESENMADYVLNLQGAGGTSLLTVHETLGAVDDNALPFGRHSTAAASPAALLQLTNDGDSPLTILGFNTTTNAFAISRAEAGTPIQNFVIDGNSTVDMYVTFTGSGAGLFGDTLTINSDIGSYNVVLSGELATPGLTIIDAAGNVDDTFSLALSDTQVAGAPSTDWFFIRNSSTVELVVNSIAVQGDGFDVQHLQPGTLQPNEKLKVSVSFAATEAMGQGDHQGTIAIDTSAGQPVNIALSATAVSPEVEINDTALTFGLTDVGKSSSREIIVSNTGTGDLLINQWTFDDKQFSVGMSGDLLISPGSSQPVPITFTPNRVGNVSAQVVVSSNDLDESATTIALTGQSNGIAFALRAGVTHTLYDGSGRRVQLSLSDGQANVYLENGLLSNADIALVEITDTSADSKLSIVTKASNTTIQNLHILGSIGEIAASGVSIGNSLQVDGSLQELELNNIADGATITVLTASQQAMSIEADRIGTNVIFDLADPVDTFRADSFAGGTLRAPAFDQIQITSGDFGADVNAWNGDVERLLASKNVTGNVSALNSVGLVRSRSGSVTGDITAQTGEIDKVMANNNITGNLLAQTNVNDVTARQGTIAGSLQAQSVDRVLARRDVTANIYAQQNIALVRSRSGSISGDIVSQAGSIDKVMANNDITGNVLAFENIDSLSARHGDLAATVRAQNINRISAENLDGALLSVADNINSVKIKNDVIDSNVLAGYDIGMNGQVDLGGPNADDPVSGGDIGSFQFGGRFDNSHVALGVIPVYSSLFPAGSGLDPRSYQESSGSIRADNDQIVGDNGGQLFGFYYDPQNSGSFDSKLADDNPNDDFLIVTDFAAGGPVIT